MPRCSTRSASEVASYPRSQNSSRAFCSAASGSNRLVRATRRTVALMRTSGQLFARSEVHPAVRVHPPAGVVADLPDAAVRVGDVAVVTAERRPLGLLQQPRAGLDHVPNGGVAGGGGA